MLSKEIFEGVRPFFFFNFVNLIFEESSTDSCFTGELHRPRARPCILFRGVSDFGRVQSECDGPFDWTVRPVRIVG